MEKIGTDKDLLGTGSKHKVINGRGRPRINRDLIIRNLKLTDELGNPKYTKAQIARMANCSSKTVTRIQKEAIESGELDYSEKKAIGMIEADFDSECIRARGFSYLGWLESRFKNKYQAKTFFNFSSRVWDKIFNKCSLVELSDYDSNVGDQMAQKFVLTFKDDRQRMRDRLKKIRFLFTFLRREDVNKAHLTMTDAKHPRAIRKVPELYQTKFGAIYTQMENEMREALGEDIVTDMRVKLVTQMRTGDKKDEREFYGFQKGTRSKSYLYMESPDIYDFHLFCKRSEEWDILWMPKEVREALYERYQRMERGDNFPSVSKARFLKHWRRITEKYLGVELILHDLRKISLTWLYVLGVPLDVAIKMNVGWKDMNTAVNHYADTKKVLRTSVREEYASHIPDWFKEGLDDFQGFEATIPNGR